MDLHSSAQDALLHEYVLSRAAAPAAAADPWSACGPKSISPFVPCASTRIPHVLRAARLSADDVLWDLGCGDGRLLHHAASQYGCRCVGVDVDAPCVTEAKERAAEQRLEHLCQFAVCDLTALEEEIAFSLEGVEEDTQLSTLADDPETLEMLKAGIDDFLSWSSSGDNIAPKAKSPDRGDGEGDDGDDGGDAI